MNLRLQARDVRPPFARIFSLLQRPALRGLSVAVLLTGPQLSPASAQAWAPTRPVTLVVPYAPGGGTDAAARSVARALGNVWGQSIVVENVPGAEGLIGTRKVMDARPDGYTWVIEVPSITLARFQPGIKVDDPLANLEPLTAVADAPPTFLATAKIPARTIAELVQYCKTAPTPCSFGAGENSAKFQAKKFAAETGVDNLIVVNYKGSAAMMSDLIAGTITLAYTGIAAALPHHKSGALRILATAGPQRSPSTPDVPTIREAGMPQFESVTWYGLFAPKGTPRGITESIAAAVKEAGKDPELQRSIQMAGAVPVMNTPAQFSEQVREVQSRYSEMARRFPLDQ